VINPGNGLQYVKIGTEQLRISKGVALGGTVTYAYGWVDMRTPSGIPLELVVGTSADPLMMACLRCSSVAVTASFLVDELGMSPQPYPYARQVGSNFEPQFPAGGIFMSFGPGQFGLLLVPSQSKGGKQQPKSSSSIGAEPIDVGNVLDAFKIIVDDKPNAPLPPPPAAKRFLDGDARTSTLVAPDGYTFRFQRYSDFSRGQSL